MSPDFQVIDNHAHTLNLKLRITENRHARHFVAPCDSTHNAMAINPLQILIFPFVFLVALPLALCAGFTTILAFLVLFLRLFLVYFDVGLETLRYVVLGHDQQGRHIQSPSSSRQSSPPVSPAASPPSSPEASSSRSRRRRRRTGSVGSNGSAALGGLDGAALTTSTGLDRDFEGVGGWRLQDGADLADEHAWDSLNSRLEIPEFHRHHHRSHSGGAVQSGTSGIGLFTKAGTRLGSTSPEGLRITTGTSPNSSRSRTPTRNRLDPFTSVPDGYFPPYAPQLRKVGA